MSVEDKKCFYLFTAIFDWKYCLMWSFWYMEGFNNFTRKQEYSTVVRRCSHGKALLVEIGCWLKVVIQNLYTMYILDLCHLYCLAKLYNYLV